MNKIMRKNRTNLAVGSAGPAGVVGVPALVPSSGGTAPLAAS